MEYVTVMGYACPVCAIPQRDGEHLAHHLAFTAMMHNDDHEAWLDEHAPDWSDQTPNGLAETVVDHAEPAEYYEVFEDTVDRGRPAVDAGTDRADHEHAEPRAHRGRRGAGVDAPDPETAAVLQEARELTQQMYADDASNVETTHDSETTRDADDRGDIADAEDGEP